MKEENKMESILSQRDELYRQLDATESKLENALKNNQSEQYIKELHEEVDGYHDNIKFLNSQLNECQSYILMIEEQKEEIEHLDLNKFLCKSTYDEVYYLFDKLFKFGICSQMTATQKQQEAKKLELKCKQLEDSKVIEHNLLTQMLDTTFVGDMDIGVPSQNDFGQPLELTNGGDTLISNNNMINCMNSTYIGLQGLESTPTYKEKPVITNNNATAILNNTMHQNLFKKPLTPPASQADFKSFDYENDDMEGTFHLAKASEHIARLEKQQKMQQQYLPSIASTNSLNYPSESNEFKRDDYLNRSRNRFASTEFTPSSKQNSSSTDSSQLLINQNLANNHLEDTMTQSMINSNSNNLKVGNGEHHIKRAPSAPSLK